MKMGDFFHRLVDDFFTSEAFWHHELGDLLRMFPFLYNYPESNQSSKSKERYYYLYPRVSETQTEAYNFLHENLKKLIEDNSLLVANSKNISNVNANGIKKLNSILVDMDRCKQYFDKSTLVRRMVLLARWNVALVTEQIKFFKNKRHIILAGLTFLPDKLISILASKNNLRRLQIINSKIMYLPDSIDKLTKLKKLKIRNTDLSYIPETLGHMIELEELSLPNNKITVLPQEIYRLSKLKILDLHGNNITTLSTSKLFSTFINKMGLTIDSIISSQNTNKVSSVKDQTLGSYWARRLEHQMLQVVKPKN